MSQAFCRAVLVILLVVMNLRAEDDRSVQQLWDAWKEGDKKAINRLIELGPEARELAERILGVTDDGFPKWPDDGPELSLLKAMEGDAVPAIVQALYSFTFIEKLEDLCHHLAELRRLARPAGDQLMTVALQEDGDIRNAALRALVNAGVKLDFVIPELSRDLRQSSNSGRGMLSGGDDVAEFAARTLAECKHERSRKPLIQAMKYHPESFVRLRAVTALREIAPQDESNVSLFIEKLDDGEAAVTSCTAWEAMEGLLDYQELPAEAAGPLMERLYRETYAQNLVWISPEDLCEAICRCPATDEKAKKLVDHKLRGLLEADAYYDCNVEWVPLVRIAAASIVLYWNPTDQEIAKFLAEAAGNETEPDSEAARPGRARDVRAHAARGLGRIGPAARDWLPVLHKILEREKAVDPPSELGFDAAWAIAKIDPDDEHCLAILKHAENEFQNWRRISWEEAERVLGNRAKGLADISEILQELRDPQFLRRYRRDEVWHWLKLRPHANVVVPAICEHLKSDQPKIRKEAARRLGLLRRALDVTIPQLANLLDDPRAVVRATAAQVLGEIGPDAAAVIPELEKALKDDYLTVRLRAEDALEAIRKKRADEE